MNKIWQGPRASDGSVLWYGLRLGTESWGNNFMQTGLAMTQAVDGNGDGNGDGGREPLPFPISEDYIRAWVVHDPEWNWKDMSFADFERMFAAVSGDLAHVEADDPDLSGFRDAGGKLILSHAANDQLVLVEGSVGYYRRVIDVMGGEKATTDFARLFVSEGDGHCLCLHPGPGILAADAMAALMGWVEQGVAPERSSPRKSTSCRAN